MGDAPLIPRFTDPLFQQPASAHRLMTAGRFSSAVRLNARSSRNSRTIQNLAVIRQRAVDCLGDFVGLEPVNVHFDFAEDDWINSGAMDRYLVVGTGQGRIQVADTDSGEVLTDQKVFDNRIDEVWFTSDGRLGCCSNLSSEPVVSLFKFTQSGGLIPSSRPSDEAPVSLQFIRKHGVMGYDPSAQLCFIDEDLINQAKTATPIWWVLPTSFSQPTINFCFSPNIPTTVS